jgi:hypothetical protein
MGIAKPDSCVADIPPEGDFEVDSAGTSGCNTAEAVGRRTCTSNWKARLLGDASLSECMFYISPIGRELLVNLARTPRLHYQRAYYQTSVEEGVTVRAYVSDGDGIVVAGARGLKAWSDWQGSSDVFSLSFGSLGCGDHSPGALIVTWPSGETCRVGPAETKACIFGAKHYIVQTAGIYGPIPANELNSFIVVRDDVVVSP